MATVHKKSTLITNIESVTGATRNEVFVMGGRLRSAVASLEIAAADSDDSTLRFFRVQSNWRIQSLMIAADAAVVSTDVDVGLYRTAADGGAVVVADCYVDLLDVSGGSAYPFTENAWQNRDIANVAQQVWQDAGLSTDPRVEYDLTMTLNTIGAAGGTWSMILGYIED